jgi:hypothetical protein
MTTPTKEPLRIIIGGLEATNNIPVDSITIELEQGDTIGTSSFLVEDAASFNMTRWQTVLIMSPSGDTQYFFGYITDSDLEYRGVVVDYQVTCSSLEVRLQKSTLNKICTGTDTEIITCMFANSLPDLTDLFDLTGITDVRLDSFDFPSLDTDLMEGLNDLATKVDANYSWSRNDPARINWNHNPNIDDSGAEYGSTIPADSVEFPPGNQPQASWVEGNTVWNSSGYMISTSIIWGTFGDFSYLRIGSADDASVSKMLFSRPADQTDYYFFLKGTGNAASTSTNITLACELLIYNEDNTFFASLDNKNDSIIADSTDRTWGVRHPIDGVELPEFFRIEYIIRASTTNPHTIIYDDIIVEMYQDTAAFPVQGAYFDGDSTGAQWEGTANQSISLFVGKQTMNWGDTPPDAPYDIDIGTTDFISDFNFNDTGLDGINTVVVTGGFVYKAFDFEYPSNNQLTHFDLEESVFPVDGETLPRVYKNTGSDVSPTWTAQTVAQRVGNTPGVGNDVTYDEETHWVEFAAAPGDLKRGWRVEGRRKERIRAIVEDELQSESDGVQLVDAVYNGTIDNEEDAFEFGLAELGRRAGTRNASWTTLEPGLSPGQEIDVVDSVNGINETLIIQRVRKQYGIEGKHGGGYVSSHVEAGDEKANLQDIVAQNNRMATDRPPITADTADQALTQLFDDDNLPLFDDDNAPLYQSVGS